MLNKFAWYAQRVRAMAPAEVVHRAGEAAKKQLSRWDRRPWESFATGNPAFLPVPGFGELCRARLPAGLEERLDAAWRQARSGELSLLGARWRPVSPYPAAGSGAASSLGTGAGEGEDGGSPIDWLHDPVTRQDWPGAEAYCFDVDYRGRSGRGDIKFVWELNRLQFLPPVAALAAYRGDLAADAWIWSTLRSWMQANPPFRGPSWNSGIELGLRVVSVALAVSLLGPGSIEAEKQSLLVRFFDAHGYWLARYPSRFSSANNHRIAEGLGLLVAGLVVPDLDRAAAWRDAGERIVLEESGRQFTRDGVAREQSTSYAAFVLEMLGIAFVVAKAFGRPFPPEMAVRLMTATNWLHTSMDGDGNVPQIGDNDDTRVVAQPPDIEPRYVASVVAGMAGLLDRADLAPPARDIHLRDLIFQAPAAGSACSGGVHVFDGGYSIVHDRIAGRSAMLVFDHGPVGYLSIAAHGHADTLSVWLHLDGRPVLVDAGTYLYHSGGRWRDAMRGAAVHNTLMVEEIPASVMNGPFMWSEKAQGRLLEAARGASWSLTGCHDGYEARFGLTHERRVAREAGAITVADRLAGAARPRPVSLSFLLAPDLRARRDDADGVRVMRGDQTVLALSPPAGFEIEIVRGDEARALGWHTPSFGRREPADQLVLRGTMADGWCITRLTIGGPMRHAEHCPKPLAR